MREGNNDSLNFTPEDFRRFADLLHQKCGMYFDDSKFLVMKTAVNDRLKASEISEIGNYYQLLLAANVETIMESTINGTGALHSPNDREMRRLIEILTVNETQFFRNKEHFRALREDVIPRLIKRHQQDRQLRIWSAGCSTGQEPYSLAIEICEALEKAGEKLSGPFGWKVTIIASDISDRALKVANLGRYRREDLRGLEPHIIQRYFLSLSGPHMQTAPLDPSQLISPNRAPMSRGFDRMAYQVNPEIKSMIKFHHFNLASAVYPRESYSNFDLVLCENVTIYFSPDVTQRVIQNIYKSMADGGFLFIGYSETLWQINNSFRLVNNNDTFYYQKPFPNDPPPTRYGRSLPMTGPLKEGDSARLFGGTTDKLRLDRQKLSDAIDNAKIPDRTAPVPLNDATVSPPPKINSALPKGLPPKSPEKVEKKAEPASSIPVPATPPDWKGPLEAGLKLIREHDFDSAQVYLAEALKLGSNQPLVLVAMAELKTKLGAYNEAAEFSRKAISLNPLSEEAHLILAMIHHREGRIQDSIAEFQKTIYINIDSVMAHWRLGDIFRSLGQNSAALREYRSTLSSLEKRRPDEIIEDLPIELLKRTCEQNIKQLGK